MSVVKCISGSGYRDTAAVQLFEGPAPTYDTRLRGVARAVVDDALSGGNVYIVSVSAISELRRVLGE